MKISCHILMKISWWSVFSLTSKKSLANKVKCYSYSKHFKCLNQFSLKNSLKLSQPKKSKIRAWRLLLNTVHFSTATLLEKLVTLFQRSEGKYCQLSITDLNICQPVYYYCWFYFKISERKSSFTGSVNIYFLQNEIKYHSCKHM